MVPYPPLKTGELLPVTNDSIIEVTTTVETEPQATALAKRLLDERLAACVQITGPIESIYRWRDEICQATEYRCTVKSSKQCTQRLVEMIQTNHPYDVPEILVVDVAESGQAYAEWLKSQVE